MKIFKTILIFIILFNGTGTLTAKDVPTSKDVKKELGKLLKDLDKYKEHKAEKKEYPEGLRELIQKITEFIQKVFKIIFNFISEFKYVILIILFIGCIIFFIFISRQSNPYSRAGGPLYQEKQEKYFDELDEFTFQELYKTAMKSANNNEYNKATIYLHIATIKYLLDSLIIDKDIEYTNNDIKKLLIEKTGLVESFSIIAGSAEAAGFSDIVLKREEYQKVNKLFEKDYLKTK